MYKGTIGILAPNCSCNSSIMAVRASYSHCADDYRTIVVISGKQDMKDNIIEVAKARLNTWSFLINRNYFKNQQVRKQDKV